MAQSVSAGLLCYRSNADGAIEVLLAHPGGPFFARKDAGVWGIPKGLVHAGEEFISAARREFTEELGWRVEEDQALVTLGSIRMKSGKTVHAWAFATGRQDAPDLVGTSVFTVEWPPQSGREQTFPEVERAEFFSLAQAAAKIIPAQQPFLERLFEALQSKGS